MEKQIRVLILEDNLSDAELMKRELRKAGFNFEAELAEDKKTFLHSLDKFTPDVILADYSLPEFDGLTALDLARKRYPDIPGIIVSGAIGEETAIEALKAGAADYVLKEHMKRVGPAVSRALKEYEQLRERRRIEEELRRSEIRYRSYVDVAGQIAWVTNAKGEVEESSAAWRKFTGQSYEDAKGDGWSKALHPEDVKRTLSVWQKAVAEKSVYETEYRVRRFDGEYRYVLARGVPVLEKDGAILEWVGTCIDITDRKKQEEQLKHSEERYSLAQRAANIGSWDWDIVTGYLSWPDTIEQLLGFKKGEFKKTYKAFLLSVHPDDRKFVLDSVNACVERGRDCNIEHRVVWPDGSVHWVSVAGNIIHNGNNKAARMLGIVQDITLKKKAEEALKKVNLKLEKKVEERTSDLITLNAQLSKEIIERKEMEVFSQARNAILDLMVKKSQRKDFLNELLGHLVIWSECRNVGIRVLNEDGRIPYEVYTGFDNEFLKQENNLSLICDQCCCIRVMSGKLKSYDKPCLTKLGSFFSNDSSEFLDSLSEKEQGTFRGVCFRKGYSSIAIIPINHRGRAIAAIHFTDENKGRFTQKKVEFLERLTPLIGEGIIKFNLEAHIRQNHINQSLINSLLRLSFEDIGIEEILQKALNMLLTVSWFQFDTLGIIFLTEEGSDMLALKAHKGISPRLQKECQRIPFSKCVCGKAVLRREVQFIDSDFHEHEMWCKGMKPHSHYCIPIISSRDKVLGVINIFLMPGYLRDYRKEEFLSSIANALAAVIEQKRTYEELIMTQNKLNEAKRLSDIGTLAATVAHELRNPLATIKMAAYSIKKKAQNPLLDKHLINIDKKISESDQIINNLLFYSRIKVSHYERINIGAVLGECIQTAKDRLGGQKVVIHKYIGALKNINIEGDLLQVKELFTNLLNNSCDALQNEKGRVEIKGALDNWGCIKVHIKDNGCGIDKENLTRVFQPFFTTKAKGTGLGLTVCSQIAKLHRGSISIDSDKCRGTEVVVTLPIKKV